MELLRTGGFFNAKFSFKIIKMYVNEIFFFSVGITKLLCAAMTINGMFLTTRTSDHSIKTTTTIIVNHICYFTTESIRMGLVRLYHPSKSTH